MRLFPMLLALSALTASAAPKVSLLKFTGPRAPQVREVLAARVCAKAECVEPDLVTTRFQPDWQKAAGKQVSVLVVGTATRKAGAVELTVQVLQDGKERTSKTFDLPKEGLAAASLDELTNAVLEPLGLMPKPEPVPVVQKKEPEPVAAPVEVAATPEPPARPAEDGFTFAGELGVNASNRSFGYLGAQVPQLRSYFLPVVALATARLEAFPFSGGLSRVGFELGGNLAPWIASGPPNSRDTLPTFSGRTDLAVQYRLRITERVRVTPLVGVRVHTFTVMGETADGRRIDGLPNLLYVTARAGASVDVRITDKLGAYGRAAVLPFLSGGELLSANYFPRGWAIGVEVTGGAGYKLLPGVEVRLSVDWTRYMFTFDTSLVTSAFFARGAADQYLGGTALVRFEL